MQIPKSIVFTIVAIYLVLPMIAGGCSTPNGGSSDPTKASDVWSTPTQVSARLPNSNGAMTRANVHGTGVYVTEGVQQLSGLQWKFKATGAGSNITTAAIQSSTVYFGKYGVLYAIDTGTGIERWNCKIADQSTSAPAVAGDTVYIGGWEEFYAISTDTGGVKWIFQSERGSNDSPFVDPVVEGGTVYFGGWKYFHALDAETGQEKWKVKLSSITSSVPTVYDETVYIGTFSLDKSHDSYLYAFDTKTGQEKWKFKATGGGIGGAVAVTNGVVYVGTRDNGLLALDARNGQEKWRYNPGSGLNTAPAVAYGRVYITDEGSLYAIDAQTGKEQWHVQGKAGGLDSDPVIADGIVYFATTGANIMGLFGGRPTGYLQAVDAHRGQQLWDFSVEGSISRAPAVLDSTVYFGSEEGTLYAVK